jgi:SAM-dependent methyltransferase
MTESNDNPRLYDDLASWWPLLSAPEDYVEEAAIYRDVIISSSSISPKTLLELGSGGGNNASHLKAHFTMTLVDISKGMLEVSRSLNPECEHIQGDMRTIRLNRIFDVVFIHDAIGYMTTERDLKGAIETAVVHCKPGGICLFCPDHVRETFHSSTNHGGHDSPDRSLRYLEWTWDPNPVDTTYIIDFAYLLRDENGIRCEHDRHLGGLFRRKVWFRLITEAGLQAQSIPFDHSTLEPGTAEIFIGAKPITDNTSNSL